MPTAMLPWFPPAPAPGPASLLVLPPDDWAMEPKVDGIRVIIVAGEPFTRQGSPLSLGKGAALLRKLVAGIPETLDAEWVPGDGEFYLFDLPDHPGSYDDRRRAMIEIEERRIPRLHLMASYTCNFPNIYKIVNRDNFAEGVVLKRRHSLYTKQARSNTETRDWLKRRFVWDKP
jgi:ATP-dependent DNA ligase